VPEINILHIANELSRGVVDELGAGLAQLPRSEGESHLMEARWLVRMGAASLPLGASLDMGIVRTLSPHSLSPSKPGAWGCLIDIGD
jgi:hypothetical protein